ncbi:MAG: TerB family tellurite resistance protein [Alphaproteobacteria bacterium]|nr:TerB family tellurite resistance protein [Alphaproteobacteria bacterium]
MSAPPDTEPMQLAVAALLVEAARADEHYETREMAIIDQSLMAKFNLSPEAAQALRAAGEEAQASALDIQRFTRIAKEMSGEEKIAFIEQLWEIVLSDGERDSYEDTLMRRICGLIYLEDRDSGQARIRVAARLASSSGE